MFANQAVPVPSNDSHGVLGVGATKVVVVLPRQLIYIRNLAIGGEPTRRCARFIREERVLIDGLSALNYHTGDASLPLNEVALVPLVQAPYSQPRGFRVTIGD